MKFETQMAAMTIMRKLAVRANALLSKGRKGQPLLP